MQQNRDIAKREPMKGKIMESIARTIDGINYGRGFYAEAEVGDVNPFGEKIVAVEPINDIKMKITWAAKRGKRTHIGYYKRDSTYLFAI